ncbi:MAG: hypothetical protein AB7G13_23105 [Lautropia sp.]
MNGVKARLKVVLQADETIVAESDDPALWQRVLVAINSRDIDGLAQAPAKADGSRQVDASSQRASHLDAIPEGADEAVVRFAKSIGASIEQVLGACSPSRGSPYLTLDMHCWNTFKDETPPRGPGSVGPMAMAATLLALWAQASKFGSATQAEAQKVLGTINLRDPNAARAIAGTEWLQGRPGGVVVVNPARIRRAAALARAFCQQDWRTDLTWKGSAAE